MTLPARERRIAGRRVRMRDREWALWCALRERAPLALSTREAARAIGKEGQRGAVKLVWLSIDRLRAIVGRDRIRAWVGFGYVLCAGPE